MPRRSLRSGTTGSSAVPACIHLNLPLGAGNIWKYTGHALSTFWPMPEAAEHPRRQASCLLLVSLAPGCRNDLSWRSMHVSCPS